MKLTKDNAIKILTLIESCSSNPEIETVSYPSVNLDIHDIDNDIPYSTIINTYYNDGILFKLNKNLNIGIIEYTYKYSYLIEIDKIQLFFLKPKKTKDVNLNMCSEIEDYLNENFSGLYDIRYIPEKSKCEINIKMCYLENESTSETYFYLIDNDTYKKSYDFCNKNIENIDNQIDFYFNRLV